MWHVGDELEQIVQGRNSTGGDGGVSDNDDNGDTRSVGRDDDVDGSSPADNSCHSESRGVGDGELGRESVNVKVKLTPSRCRADPLRRWKWVFDDLVKDVYLPTLSIVLPVHSSTYQKVPTAVFVRGYNGLFYTLGYCCNTVGTRLLYFPSD